MRQARKEEHMSADEHEHGHEHAHGQTEVSELKVDGMTCASCAASVTRVLRAQPGVRDAQVDFLMGRAKVEIDPAKADPQALAKAVDAIGYHAQVKVKPVRAAAPQGGHGDHAAHAASTSGDMHAGHGGAGHVHNPGAPTRIEELDEWTRKEMRSIRWKLTLAVLLCVPLVWIAMSSHSMMGGGAPSAADHAEMAAIAAPVIAKALGWDELGG
jgi:Cu+-exporting ATPase